jgi:hypothetical protein
LRQENSRLRYENREREKYWKAFVQSSKSTIHTHDSDVSSPFPGPSTALLHPPDSYGSNNLSYRPSASQAYDNVAGRSFVEQHTPSVAFSNHDDVDGLSVPHPDRAGKYTTYNITDSPRDARWQLPTALPSVLTTTAAVTPQSQSPSYIESPSLTAPGDVSTGYPARFPTNDRKVALDAVLSSASYVFPSSSRYQNIPDSIPNSRSMSPSTSASSATSLPLTSSYQLAFQDPSTGQDDHADFEYQGQSLPHCQVTLHGGIADISLTGHRYRFTRRSDSNADSHFSMLPQDEGVSQHDDSTVRLRGNRRNIAHPYRRSQSPGPTPLSSTVAVIKAQSFGALRRTRAKTKKTTDSAARVAQDVLEARGIGVGPMPSPKRPRLEGDDDDVGNP